MVVVLLAGTLLAVLNQTLLSPALPAIMADMQVDTTTVQWLTSGYSLVEAVIIPISAFIIGRFTTRQIFITGMSLFLAGSLLAFWSPSFWVLLLGRVFQAACTGSVMPMVTTVLLVFPRERRGFAMGLVTLVIGFAPAIGPSLAGLVIDTFGWHNLFLIVSVLALAILLLACKYLQNYGEFDKASLDLPSIALSSLGLVCLLYGLSTISKAQNIALTVGLIAAGVVLIALFAVRQNRLETPMLRIEVLKSPRFVVAISIAMITQAAIVGLGVVLPLYIQNTLGLSATTSGLVMLPGALLGAGMGLIGGRLFDTFGVRPVVLSGGALTLVGLIGLTTLTAASSPAAVSLCYAAMMCGLMFIGTPLNTWGINSLSNNVVQHANAVSNTMQQVAASMGTAVLVSLSALAPVLYTEASEGELGFLGNHIVFVAAAVLFALGYLAMIFFAREGFPKKRPGNAARVPHDTQQAAQQEIAQRSSQTSAL